MKRLLLLPLGLVLAAVSYHLLLRRPVLDWGARPDEAAGRLPGDELLEDADVVATRAISIEAPPSAVWPWLLQMGPKRGGVYTYDWIENLFGLDMHSADRIHPEWQTLAPGDVWHNPQGGGMRIELVDPERALVMRALDGTWVWAFVLVREGPITRFISRNRFVLQGGFLQRELFTCLMEPGSLVMERKMLLGIRARAERLAREQGGAIAEATALVAGPPDPGEATDGPEGEPVHAGVEG